MGKKSNRIFHLSIASVAIVLATASVGVILATKAPSLWSEFHQIVPKNWTGTNGTKPDAGSMTDAVKWVHKVTSNVPATNGTPNKPVQVNPQSNVQLVSVKYYGSHVTLTKVQAVAQLLADNHIVDGVAQSLQMQLHQPVHLYLVGNSVDYGNELAALGVSSQQAKRMTMDTGGFTENSTIIVPLYQNRTNYDLANTLAHELTHAFLNQNVDNLPSWVNEGIAVTNGMAGQAKTESGVAYAGYARQMAESVFAAAVSGTLIPLTDDEAKVLAQTVPYDLELQDWLAVRYLISTKGDQAFQAFLQRMKADELPTFAFQAAFGLSENAFNQQITQVFKTFEEQQDNGVTIQFQFPGSFQGNVRLLQHGLQTWRGFVPSSGMNTVSILPSGLIVGPVRQIAADFDSTQPDEATLYMNLVPNEPFQYQGQSVSDCGFAFDYHDGLYGFVNSWITLKDGRTIYSDVPQLFDVRVVGVQEQNGNPLFAQLIAPPIVK